MKRNVPSIIMGALLLLAYWLPAAWWLLHLSFGGEWQWPTGFPFWSLAFRTMAISFLVAALSTLAAYPFAIAWRLTGEPIRSLIVSLMVVPLLMGLLARNYSWIGLLTNQNSFGFFGERILFGRHLLYSPSGIVTVMSTVFVPIGFFILLQGIRAVRRDQVDAASTLGVPHWGIVFELIIPMTKREALLAVAYNFAVALGFFVTPRMIGGGKTDFLGNGILTFVELGDFKKASALGLAFVLLALLPTVLVIWQSIRQRKITLGR